MLIKSISGIRGIFDEDLHADSCSKFIGALASLYKGKITVGRDTRVSGETIIKFVCSQLLEHGNDILLVGIVPTPTLAYSTKKLNASAGIQITASHNPREWNGFKFVNKNGLFFSPDEWNKIYSYQSTPIKRTRDGKFHNVDVIRSHIEAIVNLPFVNSDAIKSSRIKAVYDGNGGAGPSLIIPLLEKLKVDLIPIGCEMDGNFAHPPEPLPENILHIGRSVIENKTHLGFCTDPDGDRLALIDENGKPIGEEFTLALGTLQVLRKFKGAVVKNLSTSSLINFIASRFDVPLFRTPVGEYWVSKKMLEVGAVIGGEGNGGVIVPAFHPVRDAGTGIILTLSLIAETGKTLSQLVSELPKLFMIKDKVPFSGDFAQIIPLIENNFNYIAKDTTDGLWMELQNAWIHIRKSNTEPILRIIAESEDPEQTKKLVRAAKEIIWSRKEKQL